MDLLWRGKKYSITHHKVICYGQLCDIRSADYIIENVWLQGTDNVFCLSTQKEIDRHITDVIHIDDPKHCKAPPSLSAIPKPYEESLIIPYVITLLICVFFKGFIWYWIAANILFVIKLYKRMMK